MDFSPTYTLDSQACPGVRVTLGRLGPKKRAATELKLSAVRAKHRALVQSAEKTNARLQSMLDAVPGYRDAILALPHDADGVLISELTSDILAMVPAEAWPLADQRTACETEADLLTKAEINPAFVCAAVQSISGMGVYTAEMVCDHGPDGLFEEIVAAINRNEYLPKEQAVNLPLPITSGAQGDGGQTSTSATTAS